VKNCSLVGRGYEGGPWEGLHQTLYASPPRDFRVRYVAERGGMPEVKGGKRRWLPTNQIPSDMPPTAVWLQCWYTKSPSRQSVEATKSKKHTVLA
jgi:hypothetical protein